MDIITLLLLLQEQEQDRIALAVKIIDTYVLEKRRFLPSHFDLLERWREYLELPQEDSKKYAALKADIINHFGNECLEYILHYSRLLHQTHYLRKKGLKDVSYEDYCKMDTYLMA